MPDASQPRSEDEDAREATTDRPPEQPLDDLPSTIGRYRLCGRVGAGGMGSVHLAHDGELDRMIALKVVLGDRLSESAQLRLLREAQALAKLSHPNVVAVYEAGVSHGRVFIAMELVRGETLASWALGGQRRDWRDVLALFRLAGRGLAAAHAAGIVHRDFKPTNVMIAEAGDPDARVKLLDFGIARGDAEPTSDRDGLPVDPRLTRTGAVLGTLPYIAPELHEGATAEVAADQYAFCVSLWQCLCRALPFAGTTHDISLERKRRGPPTPPPEAMPQWVAAVLARGLAPSPHDRYATMDDLLAALAEPRRRRTSWLVGGLAITATGFLFAQRDRGPSCDGAVRIAEIWDAPSRAAIVSAFQRTGLAYADETHARVVTAIDDWAGRWADVYRVACRAHGKGGDDDGQLDRTMACLERQRADLRALVDVLGRADAPVMQRATFAVQDLAAPAECAETTQPAMPEGAAAALARARALRSAGRYEDALVEARIAVANAPDARASKLELVQCLVETGAIVEAQSLGEALFFAAREAGDDEIARTIALVVARVVGTELRRPEEGRQWIRHAAALEASDADAGRIDITLADATMLHLMKQHGEARTRYEEAVALIERTRGIDDAELASPLNNLGALASERGDFDAAIAYHRRSLAIKEASFGAQHPFVASSLGNIGNVYNQIGEHGLALEHYRRADAIRSAALGPDHPEVLTSAVNTAVSSIKLGNLEEGYAEMTAAQERLSRVLGPEHPHVATIASNLGSVARRLGRNDEAARWLEQAIASFERSEGAEGHGAITPMVNLANLRRATGDPAAALVVYERAHRRIDDVLGGEHLELSHVIVGEAQALLDLGRAREAVPLAERAVALRRGSDPIESAEATFVLARATWETGDHAGARLLAEKARPDAAAAADSAVLTAIDEWLASH